MRREASAHRTATGVQTALDIAGPVFNIEAPETAALLSAFDRGENSWWSRVKARGVPLVEVVSKSSACVTFLWRDNAGCERTSATMRVYADVNSVTDHHCFTPQSLERIDGTDIWFWQVELPKDWRGTYAFIPAGREQDPPPSGGDMQARRARHREWWRSMLAHAIADPLNPLRPYKAGPRMQVSPLHLPAAPNYALWHAVDSGEEPHADRQKPIEIEWISALQNKRRTIWVYVAGWSHSMSAPPADGYPLVILLDGGNWAEQMPIQSVLEAQTAAGNLPPAVYVFVDVIDMDHRTEDMTCNPTFWAAVRNELLPLVAGIAPVTADPMRSAVAGQSYGGLAAAYAGLHMPERFGLVLSQSGSFWWPDFEALRSSQNAQERRANAKTGWLTRQVETNNMPKSRLRIFMEVGSREDDMIDASDAMKAALTSAGHDVSYRHFEGGHDGLCWRNGLIDGLRHLFAD